jgi:hypothetical protein
MKGAMMTEARENNTRPDSLKVIVWGTLVFVAFNIAYLASLTGLGYKTGAQLLVPALLLFVFSLVFMWRRSHFGKALFHVAYAVWVCLSLVSLLLLRIPSAHAATLANPFYLECISLLAGQLAVLLVFNCMLCSKQIQHYWL